MALFQILLNTVRDLLRVIIVQSRLKSINGVFEQKLIFTGSWLIVDYCLVNADEKEISNPLMSLKETTFLP